MPIKGQYLYRYASTPELSCYLTKVIFLEESIASNSGATVPTYLCQELNGQKFRCSRDMYSESEKEVWRKCLADCEDNLVYYEAKLKEITEMIKGLKEAIPKIKSNCE